MHQKWQHDATCVFAIVLSPLVDVFDLVWEAPQDLHKLATGMGPRVVANNTGSNLK